MKANKKTQKYEDDALSPVLGVVLMIAATVTIASTVYAYANDMIDIPPEVAPEMIFVAIDSNMYSSTVHTNTLTVARIDSATTLLWGDLKITSDNGDCTVPYDDNAEVTKYDVVTCPTTECRVNIIHTPTSTLIAAFTFDRDRNSPFTFTLTITYSGTGSGTVDVDPADPYYYGDTVDLTANADVGSHFVQWGNDHSGNANPDTITITGDMTVNAQFDPDDSCNCSKGPRTQGYWKNHPDAWPVDTITIGGVLYTQVEAIVILETPVRDNMTIAMFYQLVAAKLNVANCCNSSCIEGTIMDADTWMVNHPLFSGVSGSSPAWEEGEPLKDMLDAYNKGQLCAPSNDGQVNF